MFFGNKKKTVAIWHMWDLHVNSSGLSNAVITRASALSLKYNVIIITKVPFSYGYGVLKELSRSKLNSKVKVVNIYSKDLYSSSKFKIKDRVTWIGSKGYVEGDEKYRVCRRDFDDVITVYDEKGLISSYKYLDKKCGIRYEDVLDDDLKLVKRKFYSKSKTPDYVAFYDKGRYPHQVCEYKDSVSILYDSLDEFYLHRLNEFVSEFNIDVIISEYALDMDMLERSGVDVIYQWHSTCFKAPYDVGSEIVGDQVNFFKSKDVVGKMVVLTDEQRCDIIDAGLMDESKVYTIGNVVNESIKLLDVKRKRQCVFFGRIEDGAKNVSGALLIAKRLEGVVDFKFYGDGPDRDRLSENCPSNVEFMGIADPSVVFSESLIGIFTSHREGQCISLMESMRLGCIPVSYNFKYGPSDHIVDGVDGFLVDSGDIDVFVDRILLLLGDEDLCMKMSDGCIESSQKYDYDYLLKCWEKIID